MEKNKKEEHEENTEIPLNEKSGWWTRLINFIDTELVMPLSIAVIMLELIALIIVKTNFIRYIDSTLVVSLIVTMLATVLGGLIVVRIPKIVAHFRCHIRPFVTFESDFTQVFRLSKTVPNLEYSVRGKRWKKLETQNIVFGGNRGKLLLRGNSTIGTDGASISFASNADVICTGDIRTLVDYRHYTKSTVNAKFCELFYNCKQLVVAPELPATELAEGCYESMFRGCTSLKTAPDLKAEKLAPNCYSWMFAGCNSLEKAPDLLSNVLTDNCYSNMFNGCSSLKYPPKFPSRNQNLSLAKMCYYNMFYGCSSLKMACQLPAKNLTNKCYSGMFNGCASLKIAPELPATELDDNCYESMFKGCVSLLIAPELPAKILSKSCYESMFEGCVLLKDVTILATSVSAENCLINWLRDTASNGRLWKNKNATWNNDGVVPSGWKVELADLNNDN